jgi:DNA-binding response OmpR family regulator
MGDRILIVEDEINIATPTQRHLERDGFEVTHVLTGEDALASIAADPPSLLILDLNLPGMDGLEVCRRVRATSQLPIIMLTARDDDIDKIVGLEVGADDYVTKPFNARELVARVKAILRRLPVATAPAVEVGSLSHGAVTIDRARHEVLVDGEEVQLAPKEFDLLWALLEERGNVLTRDQLLERVWGYTFAGDTRTVDVHVRQLRRKLGDHCPIVTVWGVGYKVADDARAS